ncbi:MAG: right-handed parallel beta-helix repeat-containing protein [Saprospiraceae bacterium]|nr:right-handed parallel beta-helix repeat-containing protein [Saprospiraceae bacterium]
MTDPNALSLQIKELVAQDDIKGAIDLLKSNLLDMDELNQLVLKSARFEALQKRERSGTLDYTTLELEKNRLRESLLEFADSLHTAKPAKPYQPAPSRSAVPTAEKPTNYLPFIIGGAVLVIAAIAFFMSRSGKNELPANPETTLDTAAIFPTTVPDTNATSVQALEVVEVDNVEDLVKAIKSNTHIKLKTGTYDLYQLLNNNSGSGSFQYEEAPIYHQSGGASIKGIENLTITGEAGTEIITRSFSDDVMKMSGCKNILFENIFFGHPNLDFCLGGVFTLDNCKQVKFVNCTLHGSGTIGIKATKTEGLEFDRSTIEVCSQNFLLAEACSKFHFKDSFFEKTKGEIGFVVNTTPNVRIERCQIRGNQFEQSLFHIGSNSGIELIDSEVNHTTYQKLCSGSTYSFYQMGSTRVVQ